MWSWREHVYRTTGACQMTEANTPATRKDIVRAIGRGVRDKGGAAIVVVFDFGLGFLALTDAFSFSGWACGAHVGCSSRKDCSPPRSLPPHPMTFATYVSWEGVGDDGLLLFNSPSQRRAYHRASGSPLISDFETFIRYGSRQIRVSMEALIVLYVMALVLLGP